MTDKLRYMYFSYTACVILKLKFHTIVCLSNEGNKCF